MGGEARNNITVIYSFLGFACRFLLILKSAVCSPLSVRYGAIEMTALLLQVLSSFRLIIVSLAVVGTVGGEETRSWCYDPVSITVI